jgi:uncharacterized protein YegL
MSNRPGGEIASRPLHFILLCDGSGSMQLNGKIEALNAAIRESIPNMRSVASENVHAQILVRAIKFADTAEWHIGTPVKIEDFTWSDLAADGLTAMGAALSMVADELKMGVMHERGLPPVLVLITDGEPTDDFRAGLVKLLDQPWGKKSVRVAIAIGEDARLSVLEEFIANPEIKPLVAHNADQLFRYIRWASTAVLKAASSPPSETRKEEGVTPHVPVPLPPTEAPLASADVIW